MRHGDAGLDPRAWLAWAIAASLPALLGRNPWPVLASLVVALGVRGACRTGAESRVRIVRLAVVIAALGVAFNLLTYHGGEIVLISLPAIPVIGGAWTLNAAAYGAASGLALLALVVVWSTASQRLSWAAIVRLTPPALAPVAAAASIALTLAPRTLDAFADVREAQAMRGFRVRGARDLVPLLVPVLAIGLERAITTAEALESRGFGGPETPHAPGVARRSWLVIAGATTAVSGAFVLTAGHGLVGPALLAFGIGALALAARSVTGGYRPTRYRDPRLLRPDWLTIAASSTVVVVTLGARMQQPAVFAWEPYPTLGWPAVALPLLIVQALLFVPALVVSPRAAE